METPGQPQYDFRRLSEVKAELKVDYVEGNLYSLAALLPIMKDSTAELKFVGLKREKIFASREFQVVQKIFPRTARRRTNLFELAPFGLAAVGADEKIFRGR